MPKTRVTVPKPLRDQVLAEFNYRCAVCGADRPHIHHIDEDPSNNDTRNLLPLCPNCHLVDQHNPTSAIDPRKLSLFRRYKDPVILSPQFHPLFRRFAYLLDLDAGAQMDALSAATVELIAFVNALKMGAFYHVRIADLIVHNAPNVHSLDEPDDVTRQRFEQRRRDYLAQLSAQREQVVDLLIEMLRYQEWPIPQRARHLPERAT